ncbi:MAG: LysR family transcriptional regulator [Sideroxydans sp.]|nr:LysR family transcriptional regulator [Sideroxydans sp.]
MKIQHLRFLTAVVDYGGVIKASERLHLSQPTITIGLKALEQNLGKPIFDRSEKTNRPLKLTPDGRRFYQHAIEILRQCDIARANFIEAATEKNQMRIGIIDTLPQKVINNVIREVRQKLPDVEIEIWEGSPEQISKWLTQNKIDFAWTNVNDLTPNAITLWREPIVAVMPPNHVVINSHADSIALRDLEKIPFIFRSRCELDAVGRAELKTAGIRLKVKVRAEREDFAFQLVRDGEGFTFAPRSLVPDDLAFIRVLDFTVRRVIGLQWQESADSFLKGVLVEAAEKSSKQFQ